MSEMIGEDRAAPRRNNLLRFDIFTLFPEMFSGPFDASILKHARDVGIVDIFLHDIRDWTHDRHRSVDDRPYGGGAGMVMMAPPIVEAVEAVLGEERSRTQILLMSPGGVRFSQKLARSLAAKSRVSIVCGHYEGIDDRVSSLLDAVEISIGDYVLTGGEIPAMAVVDAVARLVPGVIKPGSVVEESHEEGLIEYPHFTRPVEFRGLRVPDILLSGHHQQVADWRRSAAVDKQQRRDAMERAFLQDAADADRG